MEEKNQKRKNIIKNVIIIFLAVMLVLTFASNTILNYSLPEVSVVYPTYATITKKVKGQAVVNANQSYQVSFNETRVVAEVCVKKGETVVKGDPIYILEPGESEELESARSVLVDLELQYKQKLLSAAVSDDSLSLQLADKKQQRTLLKQQLNSIPDAELLISDAEARIAAAEELIDKLNAEIEDLQYKQTEFSRSYKNDDELDELIIENQKKLDEQKESLAILKDSYVLSQDTLKTAKEYLEQMKSKLAEAQKAKDKFMTDNQISEISEDSLISIQRNLSSSELSLQRTMEEYNALCDCLNKMAAEENLQAYYDELVSSGADTARIEAAQSSLERAVRDREASMAVCESYGVGPSQSAKVDYERRIEDQNIALANERNDAFKAYAQYSSYKQYASDLEEYNKVIDLYTDSVSQAEADVTSTEASVETISAAISAAESSISELEEKLALYRGNLMYEQYKDQIDSKRVDLSAATKERDSAEKDKAEAQSLITVSEAELKNQIKSLDKEIDSLKAQIASREESDKLSEEIYNIELSMIEKQISDQEALIEKLEEKASLGVIESPVTGEIESLFFIPGEKITAGETVAAVTLVDKGYTMTYTVSNEQAALVSVGDQASVTNYWWGNTPVVRIVSIKNDPSNPNKSKILTMEVSGDVEPGQSLSFSLGEKGVSYDKVVPSSAVREDSTGKYVLVVSAKSTPLGNRYTATRVDVTVISSDETNSALQGAFAGGEAVITTSSSPISAGMQIRLAGSN